MSPSGVAKLTPIRDRCAWHLEILTGHRSFFHPIGCRLSPAVAEGLVDIDLGEGGINGAKLVPDPLDARANACPIAVFAPAGDDARVGHALVDGGISDVIAGVRCQQMDDLEFGDREIEISIVPVGAAQTRLEHQAVEMEFPLGRILARDQSQPLCHDRHAARLVHEVERAAVEGEFFVGRMRQSGQQQHRQGDAGAAKSRQEVDAGHAGKVPIEQDDVGLPAAGEEIQERGAVAEAVDRKAVRLGLVGRGRGLGWLTMVSFTIVFNLIAFAAATAARPPAS